VALSASFYQKNGVATTLTSFVVMEWCKTASDFHFIRRAA
jgi:hypothetical protein